MSSSFPINNIIWPLNGCGVINIELEWNKDMPPQRLNELLPMIQLLADCSSYGAFPIDGRSPLNSNLIVTKPLYLINTVKASFQINIESIDYRIIGVFLNLLIKIYLGTQVVKNVVTYPFDQKTKTIVTSLRKADFYNEDDYYPPMCKSLGFKIEYDESAKDPHKYRRALIITKEIMSDTTIEAYIFRINSWIELLSNNGYSLPVREPNKATFIADEPEFYDENILELYIPVFETSQLAWFSLINILEKASVEIFELEGIYIY